MRRMSDNPPSRFPERPIAEADLPWFVAHVKPRMEKAVADDCVRKTIEYYLPMATKVTRRKDNNKPRKSVLPLFPGYICIAGNTETYHSLYATGRIASIIEIKYQKKFIAELGQIYSVLEKGVVLEPCTGLFAAGTEVCVVAGPMKGIRGIVTNIKNPNRILLSVEGLGQAVMTVEAAMVKPVE
jgi:transcription antitermination factor NusG